MRVNYALVFPGQGSQSVGMLNGLANRYPLVRQTYQEASDILGFDLWALTQSGPEEELNHTENTQPALLAASVSVWKILQTETEAEPVVLAGHSLGEYSALVCAESISLDDAINLVVKRGQYMQQAVAVGEGRMAAILGLDEETIVDLCHHQENHTEKIVSVANFNSPEQTVIAGHSAAVERIVTMAKKAGAKRSVILSVSVPSHCALMKSAAERLRKDLQQIDMRPPKIPVIHNVDGAFRADTGLIKSALIEQLYRPVQWTRCVQAIAGAGATLVVECGPNKVLSGLGKRTDRSLDWLPGGEPEDLNRIFTVLEKRSYESCA